ncbi:hypothetical protein GUJ93_ZPchr0011g28509 [Zizania palustris]|uniref:Cyclin-dependent kinase inhibitor n=1 Tax=Zizania palustris TaxID=103762 RepID=A0A8J6BR11_ZIZPA|nr:hypothetical protein GUJ93_ZPchr0011g28509 [Zizania palustris]
MGKYLRSSKQVMTPPPAAMVEGATAATAASYLTLRSGRRVPAAGGGPRRRHRHDGRRCAKNAAGARKCGTTTSSSAPRQRRCKAADSPAGEQAELSPAPQGNSIVFCGDICGERQEKPIAGEVVEHDRVAGCPSLSPPEAEIEAFFAVPELAERRRFAETYV